MTEYIVEYYEKGERKPYRRFKAALPHGYKPTYISNDVLLIVRFDGIEHVPRAEIYYASSGQKVGVTYTDKNGNKKIRWKH